MANTSVVYARINSDIKREGESVLEKLGISPSSAIQMFYSQIIADRALPFTPHLPARRPLAIDELSDEQLYAEVMSGVESVREGRGIPANEVDRMLAEEFGL